MNVDVVMPKMGESIQEGTILTWVKQVGDTIERDDVLLEISTDKVDTEVPSPTSGKIIELRANEGDVVEVGNVIAVISSDANAEVSETPAAPAPEPAQDAAPAPSPEPAPAPAAEAAPASSGGNGGSSGGGNVDVVMPKMGESIQEGTILAWVKNVGDKVERDDVLLEISTDKVDTEVPSPASGTLVEQLAAEGDVVEVGNVIARLSSGAAAPAGSSAPAPAPAAQPSASPAPAPQPAPAATNGSSNGSSAGASIPSTVATASTSTVPRESQGRFYSPLVRSIAAAEGVSVQELDGISGSGLEGRVTKDDIMSFLQNRTGKPAAAPKPAGSTAKAPSGGGAPATFDAFPELNMPITDDIEVIPMDRVRTLIAEHMVRSKHTSPHVTSVAEADVTEIVKLREKVKNDFLKREGTKLTYTHFFGAAICEGVKQFPRVNVSVDGKNILQHKKINLGMAAALPDGNLIVPVVKNAGTLNVTGMAHVMNDLADKARSKKLSPDDIQGGTITLTNVGTFGSLFGSPVINQPQTCIIAVGAIQKRPVVRTFNGEDVIVIRHMMNISITYDHRVIDGALAGQALRAITDSLEGMNEETVKL